MKLSPHKVGLTFGFVWAIFLAFLTILALLFPPYGKEFITAVASVYPGYTISGGGVIVGFIYGFIDWYIGGVILVWVYNYVNKNVK